MALVDELLLIHEVQKVDYQIHQREHALKGLDSGEETKQQAIAIMKQFDAASTEAKKHAAALRDKELELKGVEQKRATVHDRLYSGKVTNPKELGDMQLEEEQLDAKIIHQEEIVLGLMEVAESTKAEADRLEKRLGELKRRWQGIVANTKAETARLQAEIAELRKEREKAAAPTDKTLLKRYDEIRQRRDGVGLVVTGNDSCPACHVKLTSRVMNLIKEGEEITLCENCGRILIWKP